jgi:hypothetical protein
MTAQLAMLPKDDSVEEVAQSFSEAVKAGQVKWFVLAYVEPDGTLCTRWSRLPSSFAAVGVAEFLKQELMDR